MENAASKVATFSPPISPLRTEVYNELDESIYHIQCVGSYCMKEIVDKVGVALDDENQHGHVTLKIMEKIIGNRYGLQFSSSMSVQDLHEFMPIVHSVKDNMKPDLCIKSNNGCALLFAEEDSHKCKDMHASITKACIYANFHCRYLATYNVRSPGYCIHFPSAHSSAYETKSLAAIIRCTWSYERFCFVYSAEALALDTLEQTIVRVVNELIALRLGNNFRDMATLYHLFKLNLMEVNASPFLTTRRWTCTSQYLSGNSIVLKVRDEDTNTQKVLKFVDSSVFGNLFAMKMDSNDCMHLLHFEEFLEGPISRRFVLVYKACLPPLTEVEAKQCLHDFVNKLIRALQAVHENRIEHCDIRLENICFRPDSKDIVLIDLDRAVNRTLFEPNGFMHHHFMMYRTKTCMFSNLAVPSVDYVQLGYMVLWISHFNETVDRFKFSGNSNYHDMHTYAGLQNEPQLVRHLIQEGAVRNNTTNALYGNDLPDRGLLLVHMLEQR